MGSRKFWNTGKSFLALKVLLYDKNISIDINGNIVKDEQQDLTLII